jgi:hypothetical protein
VDDGRVREAVHLLHECCGPGVGLKGISMSLIRFGH